MGKILVVDDDPEVRRVICDALEQAGHDVTARETGQGALGTVRRDPFDLVITDIFMPEVDGLETIRRLREFRPRMPIVAISGGRFGHVDYLDVAEKFGAVATLKKPFRMADLIDLLDDLLTAPSSRPF